MSDFPPLQGAPRAARVLPDTDVRAAGIVVHLECERSRAVSSGAGGLDLLRDALVGRP